MMIYLVLVSAMLHSPSTQRTAVQLDMFVSVPRANGDVPAVIELNNLTGTPVKVKGPFFGVAPLLERVGDQTLSHLGDGYLEVLLQPEGQENGVAYSGISEGGCEVSVDNAEPYYLKFIIPHEFVQKPITHFFAVLKVGDCIVKSSRVAVVASDH